MKTVGVILAILIVLLTIYTSGCQTVAALGRDVTWTAEGFEEMLEKGDN